mmetsp:Transcript_63550/g.151569  ORF Transcript_63550/g.151569 Transcript_63550/m.151569 type:complete len:800 (-) Transcript_63550:34-2433(-)
MKNAPLPFAVRWLLMCASLAHFAAAVRPVMDEDLDLQDEHNTAAETTTVAPIVMAAQPQIAKEAPKPKHSALPEDQVRKVEQLLKEYLNRDPDDFAWVWDEDADLSILDIPPFEEANYATQAPKISLVSLLLWRHGWMAVCASRKAYYEQFLGLVEAERSKFEQSNREKAARKEPEEGKISFAMRVMEDWCQDLKVDLMKLSPDTLYALRATDFAWAHFKQKESEWETRHEFMGFQAGMSGQAHTLMETVFGIEWKDVYAAHKVWTNFMADFGKIGLEIGSHGTLSAVLSPEAQGNAEILKDSVTLKHGGSTSGASGWVLQGEAFYPQTGFKAKVDMLLTEEEKTKLDEVDEPSRSAGMVTKLLDTIGLVYSKQSMLVGKYPTAAAQHWLADWFTRHTEFGVRRNLPRVVPTDYSFDKDQQDSGTQTQGHATGATAGDDDDEEPEPFAEVPMQFGKILATLNSDPEDFEFQWVEVKEEDLENADLQFDGMQVMGTDPALSLVMHLLFRHGFALLYASRADNYAKFAHLWANTWQEEDEITPVYYVRVLTMICTEFIAELLALGLDDLQKLHAADSKWGLRNQAIQGPSQWSQVGMTVTSADMLCSFQVEKSEKAWSLIANFMQWADAEVSVMLRANEKFMSGMSRIASDFGLDIQAALLDPRSIGELVIPPKLEIDGDPGVKLFLKGHIEYPMTGFEPRFQVELQDAEIETLSEFEEAEDRQAFQAALVKEHIAKAKAAHKKLLEELNDVQWANSMYEDLNKFKRWNAYIFKKNSPYTAGKRWQKLLPPDQQNKQWRIQ